MKILPWIVIVFLIYVIYYFLNRYEKRTKELEKRINLNQEKIERLEKLIETNRLMIEENKFKIKENSENASSLLE